MENLFRTNRRKLLGHNVKRIISRLDALLLVLKSCKASECTDPWKVLHPAGNVKTLEEALHPRFDAFYNAQPSISFAACEEGYFTQSEGPQTGYAYKRNGDWSQWT